MWFRCALTIGLFATVWWLLSEGSNESWVIGAPAVLVAAWTAQRLASPERGTVSIIGLLRFLPFFVWQSIRGGIDVARRTLAPRLRVHPGFMSYRTRLRRNRARVVLTYCINLLPGTLTADLDGDTLTIHLLDTEAAQEDELRRLEAAIARIFADGAAVPDRGQQRT